MQSVAQFSAWALARAQKIEVDILHDDDISVISTSTSSSDNEEQSPVSPCPNLHPKERATS
jgi:hypothetical protein